MKRTLLLSTSILFLFFITAFSQEQGKPSFFRNQIGIQFNPYINEQFFDFRIMNTVSALRYGYRITKNITTGMEFSCNFPINIASVHNFQIYNYFSYKIGFFTRYSILSDRRFQIFAEASPYLSHYSREWTSSSDHSAFRVNKLGYYVSPGVTLYSKSKKISLDLFYKFSNHKFINGNKSVLSYKINYNF
jgi:hypothetical protein